MRDDQLYFFIGCPGSAWSRIAIMLEKARIFNWNLSDHSPEREYYVKANKRNPDLINHLGSYFGSGMEFGEHFEEPGSYYNRISFKNEIAKAFTEHDDHRSYLIKSHALAYNLDWLVGNFPKSKIILVIKEPIEECVNWWNAAGGGSGFNITYPKYQWYYGRDLVKEFGKQQTAIKKFINSCGYPLYAPTRTLFEDILDVNLNDYDTNRYMNVVQLLQNAKRGPGEGSPDFRTMICFYNVHEVSERVNIHLNKTIKDRIA